MPIDADVAQLVARNLAKVQVAGSTPVVRSINEVELFKFGPSCRDATMVEWPRGEARDCKSRYTGSNPVSTSKLGTDTFLQMYSSRSLGRLAQR